MAVMIIIAVSNPIDLPINELKKRYNYYNDSVWPILGYNISINIVY